MSFSAELVKRQRRPVSYALKQRDFEQKHVGGANAIAVGENDVIFTGGRDGSVRAWDLSVGMPSCSGVFEGHAAWVNDVARLDRTLLASASSDHTVRLWNTEKGEAIAALQAHTDYVMALANPRDDSSKFASGGLGAEIFLWDVEKCVSVNAAPVYLSKARDDCLTPLTGSKESIYALAMNGNGNILVSGGTENALRVWDTRTNQKEGKLKGHTDNVRAICVNEDGKRCVTASSDRTIRVWDIGEQRCVQTFAGMHSGSIWALAMSEDFARVYSGGLDKRICVTNLTDRRSSLLSVESAAILKLKLDGSHRQARSDGHVWTATASRSIKRWPANFPEDKDVEAPVTPTVSGSFRRSSVSGGASPGPSNVTPGSISRNPGVWFDVGSPGVMSFGTPHKFDSFGDISAATPPSSASASRHLSPSLEITGISPIVRHAVLHDKRHVLTQDSVGSIALWDVTKPSPVKTFDGMTGTGSGDFESLLEDEELNPQKVVPSWFSVDARSGSLSVTLTPSSAFQAEAYAKDGLGVDDAPDDERRNLGAEVIHMLMDGWARKLNPSMFAKESRPRRAFAAESSFALTFAHPSSGHGKVCVKVNELTGTSADCDILPKWLVDHALELIPPPDSPKISFTLAPASSADDAASSASAVALGAITPSSVSAPKILGTKKISQYVWGKLQEQNDPGITDASSVADLQLSCAGVRLDVARDESLATVNALYWKNKSPPVAIEYSLTTLRR
jgi:WD repeat-containing protein 48